MKCLLVIAVSLSLGISGCSEDSVLPLSEFSDSPALASVGSEEDVITSDPLHFANLVRRENPENEIFIWLRDSNTPPISPSYFASVPSSAAEYVAVTKGLGIQRRLERATPSINSSIIDRVERDILRPSNARIDLKDVPLAVICASIPDHKLESTVALLLNHPNVDYLSINQTRIAYLGEYEALDSSDRSSLTPAASPIGSNPTWYNHQFHNVTQAWDITRGATGDLNAVGILGSGFTGPSGWHPDGLALGSFPNSPGIHKFGFVNDYGSCNQSSGACTPYDDWGIGTWAAGVIGANDNNIGYVGIAPFATVVSMKISHNRNVSGSNCANLSPDGIHYFCVEEDDLLKGLIWARTHVKVLTFPFTMHADSDIYTAIDVTWIYGIFMLATSARQAPWFPADHPKVAGVCSVDGSLTQNRVCGAWDFSAYFGANTLSPNCYPGNVFCQISSPPYGVVLGDFVATSNAAGIAALVAARYPASNDIWSRMVSTATGPYKLLNASAAVQ